jgi:hypothetical protein
MSSLQVGVQWLVGDFRTFRVISHHFRHLSV